MKNNHVLVIDDLLTSTECDILINRFDMLMDIKDSPPRNYFFYDIIFEHEEYSWIGEQCLKLYEKAYPELTMTVDRKTAGFFRIKKFINNDFYNGWHSEHCVDYPTRTASILIYLSDHNCGTEFLNGDMVQSKKGRVLMFPATWTHTHRGQPCPDGKNRYIMSAYIELEK